MPVRTWARVRRSSRSQVNDATTAGLSPSPVTMSRVLTDNRPKARRAKRSRSLDDWHPDHARSLYTPPTAKPPPSDPTQAAATAHAEASDTTARARERAMRARRTKG